MRINAEDKRAERESSGLLPIIAGVVVALAVLTYLAPEQRIDFGKAGLGIGTEESFGVDGEPKYHCYNIEDGDPCIAEARSQAHMRQILWLGGSQLHSINDTQPGDRTAVAKVHDQMLGEGVFVSAFSVANGNFQEFYVLFEHLRPKIGVNVLVIGAVYDDMRESGIRAGIVSGVSNLETAASLEETPAGNTILERYGVTQQAKAESVEEQDFNTQQRAEDYLNERLAAASNVWAARADFRGQLYWTVFNFRKRLMTMRNRMLDIDTSAWKVRIDKAQYALNRSALDATLQSAARAKIPVLLYIVPRPIDAYFPYEPGEYADFKDDMADLATRNSAYFVNLEDAVVGDVWGSIDNGVGEIVTDIFHFKHSGHAQFADGVIEALDPVLKSVAARENQK